MDLQDSENLRRGYNPDPNRVRELQRELRRAGYWDGPDDGQYTEQLERAVSRFQEENGVGVDGWAGFNTGQALNRVTAARQVDPLVHEIEELVQEQLDLKRTVIARLRQRLTVPDLDEARRAQIEEDLYRWQQRLIDELRDLLSDARGRGETGGPGRQRSIVATVIGTTDQGLNPNGRWGAFTDVDLFVALPCRHAARRWVRLYLSNGCQADVPVGDIGPWNGDDTPDGSRDDLDDCYWEHGARPHAEGHDRDHHNRRYRNHAGIDLSSALWRLLGLPGGMTTLDWEFIDPPEDGNPRIRCPGRPELVHRNRWPSKRQKPRQRK